MSGGREDEGWRTMHIRTLLSWSVDLLFWSCMWNLSVGICAAWTCRVVWGYVVSFATPCPDFCGYLIWNIRFYFWVCFIPVLGIDFYYRYLFLNSLSLYLEFYGNFGYCCWVLSQPRGFIFVWLQVSVFFFQTLFPDFIFGNLILFWETWKHDSYKMFLETWFYFWK